MSISRTISVALGKYKNRSTGSYENVKEMKSFSKFYPSLNFVSQDTIAFQESDMSVAIKLVSKKGRTVSIFEMFVLASAQNLTYLKIVT